MTRSNNIFVFSKRPTYFWDSAASKEAATCGANGSRFDKGKTAERDGGSRTQFGYRDGTERNPRTVWTISSEPTSEKHFATFPSELVRRCLVAGVSAGGCCPTCGAPWAPMIETERVATRPGTGSKVNAVASIHPESPYHDHAGVICGNRDPQRHNTQSSCLGYRATCDCPSHEPTPCTVLDPFSGLGTTGQTARHLGHNYIGCELNPEYAALSERRIASPPRWWLRQQAARPVADALPNQRTLFEEVEP